MTELAAPTVPDADPDPGPGPDRSTALAERVRRRRWSALGTWVELLVLGSAADLDAATTLLERELDGVDRACSRFRPDSELVAANAAAGRRVTVSPRLAAAVAAALRAAAQTDGDVDPALGRSLEAAGYDRDLAALPSDGPTVRPVPARAGGWREVELDVDRSTLRVPAGTALDLGATAKALAADAAAARIGRVLDVGTVVNLGGDLAVGGPVGASPPGGWPVGVSPSRTDPGPGVVVTVTSGGVASSSTELRRWRRGGVELHHVLDPRTGLPAEPVWRLVSVAAASCVDANTASTASVVRGAAVVKWLAGLGLPARLVAADGAVSRVGGWPGAA